MRIEKYLHAKMMNLPIITIVICTQSQDDNLRRCLKEVLSQQIEKNNFSILVVDNGLEATANAVVAEYEKYDRNIKYIYVSASNLSMARNAGLEKVTTRYVAYIDVDATPHASWLEEILQGFEAPERPVAVGGEITPIWQSSRPEWLVDSFLHDYSVCLHWDSNSRPITDGEWLCLANIACDTEVLRRAGGFAGYFDQPRGALLSGKDFVFEKMKHAGGILYYVPYAKVDLHIPAAHICPDWLMKQRFWIGAARACAEKERARLFNEVAPWQDLRLPCDHLEWARLFNRQPDSRFPEICRQIGNLGYLLTRMGVIQV